MKLRNSIHGPLATVFALSLTGCLALTEESVGSAEEEIQTTNALSTNALSTNALSTNALSTNALSTNALSTNALSTNALSTNALKDPAAREVLKYITSCALPADAHVDVDVEGTHYTFNGGVGLAPEWGLEGGSCGPACRGWVSACVIARINHEGVSVPLSIRASPKLESTSPERAEYTKREGAYYGNIFESSLRLYACTSPGETSIPRVCGDSGDECAVKVLGSCATMCESPSWDGSFRFCRTGPFGDPKTSIHPSTITVFLH